MSAASRPPASEYNQVFAERFQIRYGFSWLDTSHPTPADYDDFAEQVWRDVMGDL